MEEDQKLEKSDQILRNISEIFGNSKISRYATRIEPLDGGLCSENFLIFLTKRDPGNNEEIEELRLVYKIFDTPPLIFQVFKHIIRCAPKSSLSKWASETCDSEAEFLPLVYFLSDHIFVCKYEEHEKIPKVRLDAENIPIVAHYVAKWHKYFSPQANSNLISRFEDCDASGFFRRMCESFENSIDKSENRINRGTFNYFDLMTMKDQFLADQTKEFYEIDETLIHGDLHPLNLLLIHENNVEKSKRLKFVDFEHSLISFWQYDISMLFCNLGCISDRHNTKNPSKEFCREFIAAYLGNRPELQARIRDNEDYKKIVNIRFYEGLRYSCIFGLIWSFSRSTVDSICHSDLDYKLYNQSMLDAVESLMIEFRDLDFV
ncbi:MAG: hypothetical protein MHMPM18_002436 [Marteilia pararefringens]